MFVFASRKPFVIHTAEQIAGRLAATPEGRLALAMQDLYGSVRSNQDFLVSNLGAWALGKAFLKALRRSLARRLWGQK